MIVLLVLLSVLVQDVVGILGGCMSYSTTIESSGQMKVNIFFLNGWKIEKGPCPTCTAADKGSDVTERRKLLIQQKHNQEMFGKWEAEVYDQTMTALFIDKTRTVNDVSKDVVLIVGEKDGWELIGSEISLDFNLLREEFDIMLNSSLDVSMTLLPVNRYINLQVKVESGIRNDTHRPNRSPIVLVKPLYSLEIGKIHTIHLTSVDNDGDAIRCEKSLYWESSGFGEFVKNLTTQNLLSLNRMTCVMRINVSQSYFHENDTFGVAVTVKDYGTHPLSIQSTILVPHIPYINVIGRVVALMYFKITGKTDPPEIIPPTPRNDQEYTIYVGGDLHVDVYAKASAGRHIVRFDFLRPDGKPVNQTSILPAPNISSNAVFISISWSPTELEKGHHILCANAEDNKGIMTVDLHCFRIVVKENTFRPTTAEKGKPYFVSFPEPTDLNCNKGTYCRFPVYATTPNSGGITSIVSTSRSKENVTIQCSRILINGTIIAKVAQVEFLADQAGARQICLKASDGLAYVERCLYVIVDLPDPCASEPCQNSGSCYSFNKNTKYTCSCTKRFSGLHCEKKKNPCDANPCLFNGRCYEVPFNPYFFCLCLNDRRGDICQIDTSSCAMNSCSNGGFCDDHLGKKTCLCPMGFSGENCSTGDTKFHAENSAARILIATDMVCCSISTKKSDTDTYSACNDDTDDCRDPRALNNICSDPTTAIYCRKSCKLCRSMPINREKELFIRPSPQNSSIYTCSPGVECHMLLYMNSGDNESCPSVSVLPTADITVHIFNNYNGDRCSVDILIKPFSSPPGQVVNLCVKASQQDSKLSEIRCYAVEYVEHRSVQESMNFPETTTTMTQRTINTDLANVFG